MTNIFGGEIPTAMVVKQNKKLSRIERGQLIVGALVIFGLFAVASRLTPNSSGYGTHQQLGLPPCSFQLFCNIPCPTCGFTTSWSYLMHGQLNDAVQTNLGAVLLWLLGAVSGVWMFVSGCRGKWFLILPSAYVWAAVVTPMMIVIFTLWIFRLVTLWK